MLTRAIPCTLAAICLSASASVCAAQFGCQSQTDAAQNPKDYFKPDIPYVDGTNTFTGPARGYAPGGWTVFMPEGLPKWHGAGGYHSSLWEISRFSGGRAAGDDPCDVPGPAVGRDHPARRQKVFKPGTVQAFVG